MTPDEREGRRAAVWWSYCWGRKTTPHGGYDPILGGHPEGWEVRVSVPRLYRYGVAAGRAHPQRKVHMVRDQIVAVKGRTEVRRTAWLCGATTFDAALTKDAPDLVCSACLLVSQRRSVEPMPAVPQPL